MRLWQILIVVALLAGLGWYLMPDNKEQIQYQTQSVSRGDIESVVNTAGTPVP